LGLVSSLRWTGTWYGCGYLCPIFPDIDTCTRTRHLLAGTCPPSQVPAGGCQVPGAISRPNED
jgi:hypothetical protein